MTKCRIQRNNCQMSKQYVKMCIVYFCKIHLRNMSHHLEQYVYWKLLLKQSMIPLSCLIWTFKFKTNLCFAFFFFLNHSHQQGSNFMQRHKDPQSFAFSLHWFQFEINHWCSILWEIKKIYFSLQLIMSFLDLFFKGYAFLKSFEFIFIRTWNSNTLF